MQEERTDGWICLHRQIRRNLLWGVERFPMVLAWIDLLLRANHKDTEKVYRNMIIRIKRGQLVTSAGSLAEHWGWDIKTVRKFLKKLEKQGMITTHRNNTGTYITITNYDKFQNQVAMDSDKDSNVANRRDTHNNINNINKKNNKQNIFCNFEQREYDFQKIEQKLLGKDCEV